MATLLAWLPNTLSLLRLALGLAFPWLPAESRLGVVLFAAFSDAADGEASRYFHVSSDLGRFLDPVADKVFLLGVVVGLLADGTLAWWEVVLLAVRDLAVVVLAGWVLLTEGPGAWRSTRARLLGKAATLLQFLFLLALLLDWETPGAVLFWSAVAAGCLAGADYAWVFVRERRKALPPCPAPPERRE